MTLRITASSCSFTASAVDQEAVSPVLNLNDFISTKVQVRPTAITLVEAPPADLVVSQVLLRSTKNPEIVHRLYKGPKVPIGAVLGAIGRNASRNEELTALRFPSDHGVELVFAYDNGTTALTATFLWDIANAIPSDVLTDTMFNEGLTTALFGGVNRAPGPAINQIIQNAGTSMLAQANQAQGGVLSLLDG